MAIWQLSMELIKKYNDLSCQLNNKWNLLKELSMFFPETKSWCESIRQFGNLDSTCIEINLEDGNLFLRVDLRNITQEQLEIIIRFANSNELQFKYNNRVYEPTLDNLTRILKTSSAYRYIKDPKRYFDTISRTKNKTADGSVS